MAYCNLDKVIYPGIGKYDIPEIEPFNGSLEHIEQWIGFNYVKTEKYCKNKYGVHFCLDDYQFETIWNHSNKYVQNFRNCGAICSPDFSLYLDFPRAIQIYNHYRKHWLARYYQERGITVIPTIAWSDEESLNWCFDGEPKHSIVATSCTGTLNDENAFAGFHPKLGSKTGAEAVTAHELGHFLSTQATTKAKISEREIVSRAAKKNWSENKSPCKSYQWLCSL